MEKNTNQAPTHQFAQKPDNKGYSIMHNDEYVGYVVIHEKQVAKETIEALQNPAIMKRVFAEATLKKFEKKVDKTNTSIAAMVAEQEDNIVDAVAANLKANS